MTEPHSFWKEEEKEAYKSPLLVVKDGEAISISFGDLFDTTRFQTLRAVSFVASPVFFFSVAQGFNHVTLVLGIEDIQVAQTFQDGLQDLLNIEKRVAFFQELPPSIQKKVADDRFLIRYASPGHTVHSKIYLMEGAGGTRCMIGSANMTKRAFENKEQFEELMVFDNSPLFALYEKRFQAIYEQTNDCIPDFLKKKTKEQITWMADAELFHSLLTDELTQHRIQIALTEEEIEDIQHLPRQVAQQQEEAAKFKQKLEVLTKKDRTTNVYTLHPPKAIDKKASALKHIMGERRSKENKNDPRGHLHYDDQSAFLYTPESFSSKEKEPSWTLYSKPYDTVETLSDSLAVIEAFIDAYDIFTVQTNLKNQSRVFEMILYSFSSVFLWKMRDDYSLQEGRKAVRRYFPPFLIVSGRSMAGKTTALEFIDHLLGGLSPYKPYETIQDTSLIWDALHAPNVTPLLIDEMDTKFFSSTAAQKGERLIKLISNENHYHHPVLIGTTNASGFDISPQTSNRIYYLQLRNAFQKQQMAASSRYINDLMPKVNAVLFQDFTYRMGQKITNDEPFYDPGDFLSSARQIFREYYAEAGRDLPPWFPRTLFRDYEERGMFIWEQLYRSHREVFDIREDDTILVDIEKLGARTNRERTNKINFLPVECIIEDSPVLVLHKKLFFSFIGIEEKKDSFLKRILETWKKEGGP